MGLPVDVAIFTVTTEHRPELDNVDRRTLKSYPNRHLELLLVQRIASPYKEKWTLPGRFTHIERESLDEAATRELKEETNLDALTVRGVDEQDKIYLEQMKAYYSPDRDPRGWTPTVAFIALVNEALLANLRAGGDAKQARLFRVQEDEPKGSLSLVSVDGTVVVQADDLAFDHAEIIHDAIQFVRTKMMTTTVASKLLPEEFTISELHHVISAVVPSYRTPTTNFARDIVKTKSRDSLLEEVVYEDGSPKKSSQYSARPAQLYRFNKEFRTQLSIYPRFLRVPICKKEGPITRLRSKFQKTICMVIVGVEFTHEAAPIFCVYIFSGTIKRIHNGRSRNMDFEFAAGVSETRFRGLNEALNYLNEHSLRDKLVSTSEVTLASTNDIRLGNRKPIPMTRAAFVQLLHFVRLSWSDVKEEDPVRVAKAVRRRLTARPGTLMFRIQRGAVQAVLSPAYTPITNADVLHSVRTSLDLSKTMVTFYRGQMRITGVSDRISFQAQVGDIISGGWEITNNQFGKGSIRINQFLLRLVCTNGAVIETGSERRRLVHRGWDRDELIKHVGDISSVAVTANERNQ